eukprot:Opistho-2@39025
MPSAKEGIRHQSQRRGVGVDRLFRHQPDETPVHGRIFLVRRLQLHFAVQTQGVAAFGQEQAALVGIDRDIPCLRAGLAPVEHGVDRRARRRRHGQRRADRRLLVRRDFERSRQDGDRLTDDFRQDREGIDARIEHAEAARFPDPGLARMPVTDILAPLDVDPLDLAFGHPRLGLRHGGGIAAVPAGIERDALALGQRRQCLHFGHGRARRLFQKHMLARQQRLPGSMIADLRRLAEDDGIEVGFARQHRAEVGVIIHPFPLRVAAGDGDQFDAVDLFDGGQVLIARDLAEPYQTCPYRHAATSSLPS